MLAHVDTSPDAPGSGVSPIVHERYSGGELVPGLSPETSHLLGERIGDDIVTSDGTTLLGADDKAGVAEIMAAAAYLVAHPEISHAPARIGFTVDEEVGHGTDHFDLERFGAPFAYTLDGSEVGEIEDETFSAVELKVTFPGVGVHPGTAKGKLVNPVKLAARFVESLPATTLSPETTEGREGFVHPHQIEGGPESATVSLILRDHDNDKLAQHETLVRQLALEVSPDATLRAVGAVPEHGRDARRGAARRRGSARGDAAGRARAETGGDPGRHRRVAAHGDGPADTQRLHGRQRVSLGARVDQRAGHGDLGRNGRRVAEAVGGARMASAYLERLVRAKDRLDRLDFYPRPVRIDHTRIFVVPLLYRLPWFRRFDGYAAWNTILLRTRPVDASDDDLITHELCHVWQMQHHPLAMPLSYLRGYAANRYESEAREAVERTRVR